MCCGNKFCCSETKNVFARNQKHFCFLDSNFAPETYVSQFSHIHPGKHNKKHCFRNNVSQFSQAFRTSALRRYKGNCGISGIGPKSFGTFQKQATGAYFRNFSWTSPYFFSISSTELFTHRIVLSYWRRLYIWDFLVSQLYP